MFLSRDYQLVVALRKFNSLKTKVSSRSDSSRAYMLVLRASNYQGATIRPIVPKSNKILFVLMSTKFVSAQKSLRLAFRIFSQSEY